MNKYLIITGLILFSFPTYAYVGPGIGGGVIAAIIGFFVAIFLGLFGILYYPIKRAYKNRKKNIYDKKKDIHK